MVIGCFVGVTTLEAAVGYFLLRYVFHASLWWLLTILPLFVIGLWFAYWPTSFMRFSKKMEDATNPSPNYPRNFFP
jgi:H+/Cl- antiporter ClcA